jgi:hypothetical protein
MIFWRIPHLIWGGCLLCAEACWGVLIAFADSMHIDREAGSKVNDSISIKLSELNALCLCCFRGMRMSGCRGRACGGFRGSRSRLKHTFHLPPVKRRSSRRLAGSQRVNSRLGRIKTSLFVSVGALVSWIYRTLKTYFELVCCSFPTEICTHAIAEQYYDSRTNPV